MNSALKPLWKRRTFWCGSFCGRVLLLALANGGGSTLMGLLVGMWSWSTFGSSYSWLSWVFGIVFECCSVMMIYGLIVGGVVCSGIAAVSRTWSVSRKSRFSLGFMRHLLLPLFAGLLFTPLVATVYWLVINGGFSTKNSDLGDVLGFAQFIALVALPLLLGISSIYLSKKKHMFSRTQKRVTVLSERLLPLD